ncbi:hypothetical protein HDU79_003999 [Rhizoclosmatium sp. JEL0117]|nr:hypothetical protein HDU79_003999 [Rhizoclosmatium sp. JEL0117]
MSNIMSAFLARGKGIAPNFTPNPQQVAKEKLAAKWKRSWDCRQSLPVTNHLPSTSKEGTTGTPIELWYISEVDLPDLPPTNPIHTESDPNVPKTYFSKDPAVQKLYDEMWHVWAADGTHTRFKTITQWITDVKAAYNISVPHSTAGDYRKKYFALYEECRSNNWSSNGPLALKMKRQALRVRPNLIEAITTVSNERQRRKSELEPPLDNSKLGADATAELVALCVEHKDYAGFLVDIVGMFASIVHQKFYLFEPKWNPSILVLTFSG